jgi:ABC-type dipeptide/oligopeptide/nickel transport system permease subunit
MTRDRHRKTRIYIPRLFKFMKFGWEFRLGVAIITLMAIAAAIVLFAIPQDDIFNTRDIYCTPCLAGRSYKQWQKIDTYSNVQDNDGTGVDTLVHESEKEYCSRDYVFGTNVNGKDIFSMVFKRFPDYIIPSFVVGIITIIIGIFWGVMSGYYEKNVFSYIASILSNSISVYPPLLFVVLAVIILDPSLLVLGIVFGLTESIRVGNTIMNKIRSLKQEEFIAASKEMGLSHWRIISKNILWYNCRELVIIHFLFAISAFVMIELYLGYLNVGNFQAWGEIIGPGARDFSSHPWILLLPSSIVMLFIVALYLVGDGLMKYFNAEQEVYK